VDDFEVLNEQLEKQDKRLRERRKPHGAFACSMEEAELSPRE
jgi:hypothetical protein